MTVPVVRHPSVGRIVKAALLAAFAPGDVVVGRRVPVPRPTRFLLVTRLGGTRGTAVSDRPRLSVEAWAADPDAAEDLAQKAREAIHRLAGTTTGGVIVYRVADVSAPQDLPHPSGQPRMAFTVELHVRTAP